MNQEDRIIIESAHFYAYMLAPTRIQIRLQQVTGVSVHTSMVVGEVATAAAAHRFIERLERYPHNLTHLVNR